jgi:hypothetical protein
MRKKFLVCAVIFCAFALAAPDSGRDGEPVARAGAQPKDGEGELAKLGRARAAAAEKAYKVWFEDATNERPFSHMLYALSVRWLDAENNIASKKSERIAAYAAHLQRMMVVSRRSF